MKTFKTILFQFFLLLWQLPQCFVALLMIPFIGKLTFVAYRNYAWAFKATKMQGAISLGCFIFLSPYTSKRETTIAHELDGHTVDSKIFGPLYLFIIGVPSIIWAGLYQKLGYKNYYQFFTEKRANKHAGLGVDTQYRLYFLDKPNYKK